MNTEFIKDIALTEEEYVKPQIEVISVDSESSILASSSPGSGGGFGSGGVFPGW